MPGAKGNSLSYSTVELFLARFLLEIPFARGRQRKAMPTTMLIGQIPTNTFIETPFSLSLVLWADFIIFFFFAMKNYFGPYKKE